MSDGRHGDAVIAATGRSSASYGAGDPTAITARDRRRRHPAFARRRQRRNALARRPGHRRTMRSVVAQAVPPSVLPLTERGDPRRGLTRRMARAPNASACTHRRRRHPRVRAPPSGSTSRRDCRAPPSDFCHVVGTSSRLGQPAASPPLHGPGPRRLRQDGRRAPNVSRAGSRDARSTGFHREPGWGDDVGTTTTTTRGLLGDGTTRS